MAITSWVVDVTDPNSAGGPLTGLSGLQTGAGGFGTVNSTRLQAIIDAAFGSSATIATCRGILFFPPRLFEFSNTVTFPNTSSFRVVGGGGTVKALSQIEATVGNCTILRWRGGNTGPMFRLQDSDGTVWENINFDGLRGPQRISGDYLDTLFLFQRNVGNVGALYTHFKNCSWFRAQRLFSVLGTIGTAEITFSKCMFNCGDTGQGLWDSVAFYNENEQSVNNVFDSNCQFNNCGYCAYLVGTGRIVLAGPTVTQCGTILFRSGGSQNINGDRIDYCHIDGGDGSEGRKALYKSSGSVTSFGQVVIETPKYGTVGTTSDEFADITSYSGTTLQLAHPIRMRAGDKVAFFRKDDNNNAGGTKLEAEIFSRSNDTFYATVETAGSLGFSGDIEDNYYAANGEALITCASSDFVHLRNAQLTAEHIWGGRLARLTSSAHSGGRCPKLHIQNSMCEWGVDFNETGLQSLLNLTGTTWWRFENAARLQGTQEPITVGNFGVFDGGGSGGDTFIQSAEERVVMREYGQLGIEMFVLRHPETGLPVTGLSFAAGDVTWYKDGVSQGNTTNLPAAVGGGVYALTVTAAERTSQQTLIKIADQTNPAAWIAKIIDIDSYGNASARHKLNINETNVKSNTKAIADDSDAAVRQSYGAGAMAIVTVGSGSTVTTVITSSIDPPVLDPQQYQNRALLFLRTTTTPELRGKAVPISATSAGGQFTVSGLQTAPVSGDLAIVV